MVVGSGGREHALVEALAASPLEPEMYAAPGNPGIARIAQVADIPADDLISLRDYATEKEIDLTVVGPESPLIGGIAEAFGEADERIVIEEYLEGREASIFVLTDGQEMLPFLPAQDYKRIYDGGEGPNTGGMGAYSPLMWMEPATYASILEEIIRPAIHQLALIGAPYTGLLYAGVMVTETGPKALEFNCRFGDPETQVILPRLGSDLLELMLAANNEDLAGREVVWSADKAVCVVLASEGYPESSSSGDEITGLENIPAGVYVYHAATEERDGRFYTAGGRVLNVVGTGPSVIEARARAYAAVEQIHFEGMHYRTDIALEAIELEDL